MERLSNADEDGGPNHDLPERHPGGRPGTGSADLVGKDDPHKAEKLTKAGRTDFDPNEEPEA